MVKNLPIAYKISLILLAIWMVLGVLTYMTHKWIIFPAFIEIEQEEAQKNGQRAINSIEREIHFLEGLCRDWSFWDDTYEFAGGSNPDFVKRNINTKTYETNELNLLYVVDQTGKVIWGKCYDLLKEKWILISEIPSDTFLKTHPMTISPDSRQSLNEQGISGIIKTDQGFMLFSSQPVLTSDHEGPVRGMVIMGRLMNPTWLNRLSKQTQLALELISLNGKAQPEGKDGLAQVIKHLTQASTFYIHEKEDAFLDIFTPLFDIRSNRILILKITLKGKVLEKGKETLTFALYSSAVAFIAILLLVFFIISTAIVNPISALSKHINTILKTGDLSSRIHIQKHDEVGTLGDHYNQMLDKLEKKTAKLNELAITDPLTGLFNRRYIITALERNLAIASRYSRNLGVIIWDIDHFKKVNDTYGHKTGDKVLIKVSQAIQEALRTTDIIARFGGEEFLMVLPDQDEKGTRLAGNRIRELIESLTWKQDGLKVTISGGICTDTALAASEMVARADKNLYAAKHQGRNRVL